MRLRLQCLVNTVGSKSLCLENTGGKNHMKVTVKNDHCDFSSHVITRDPPGGRFKKNIDGMVKCLLFLCAQYVSLVLRETQNPAFERKILTLETLNSSFESCELFSFRL